MNKSVVSVLFITILLSLGGCATYYVPVPEGTVIRQASPTYYGYGYVQSFGCCYPYSPVVPYYGLPMGGFGLNLNLHLGGRHGRR